MFDPKSYIYTFIDDEINGYLSQDLELVDISDLLTETKIDLDSLDISPVNNLKSKNLQILDEYPTNNGFNGIDELLKSLDSSIEFATQSNSFNKTLSDNSLNPESVFGSDHRTQITNTTDYPWSSIARIEIQFSNGTGGFGSGAMISPYHILTAGHVVHNANAGGWASDLSIFLGQDGNEQFYGEAKSTYIRSYTGWTNEQNPDHDWALITLDRNIGDFTGWFGYEWRNNSADYSGMTVNTAGYPGDLSFNAQDMYFASGPVAFADTHQLYYNGTMDTYGGQSGSPVWRYNSSTGERYINGIHAYGNSGDGYNKATRITETKFNSLQDWISEDDSLRSPIDKSDLVDYDNWFNTNFAYFSASTVAPGENITLNSVIRNNGTATAGSFNVSFYASTNLTITTYDYFIGNTNISSLDAFDWTDAIWTGTFPNIPSGDYYIGWLIDSGDSQIEFSEDNNTGIINDSILTVQSVSRIQETSGNNVIAETASNDTIKGLDGDNFLEGYAGLDRLNGGGEDSLHGGADRDTLTGGGGDDFLSGGGDRDILKGNQGNDILFGGGSNDILFGNGGTDYFMLLSGQGRDTIRDFTDGVDYLTLGNGLTFDDLSISNNSQGTAAIIRDNNNNALALVDNVDAAFITELDFIEF